VQTGNAEELLVPASALVAGTTYQLELQVTKDVRSGTFI